MAMLPYVVTIFAVAGLVGRVPAAGRRRHAVRQGREAMEPTTDRPRWTGPRSTARPQRAAMTAGLRAVFGVSRWAPPPSTDDGRIVSGCNVENASYGLTLCAECSLVANLQMTGGGQAARPSTASTATATS